MLIGAAGRDFHNYLTYFKNNPNYEVIAFTQAQIPGIEKRKFPKELTGKRTIPFYPERKLPKLIKKLKIDECFLCYSDLTPENLTKISSIVLSSGANFSLLNPLITMLESKKPVISVCATRTGAGKGTVTRRVLAILKENGYHPIISRHPMPYGKLENEIVERFASMKDLDKYYCTLEEREEYVPYIEKGYIVYAGVDYKKILAQAEKEADVIVFEGGNNDVSFFKSDLYIVVADPLRPEGVFSYPGEINIRLADLIIINKAKNASKENIELTIKNIREVNKKVKIIRADSAIKVDNPNLIKNKLTILVEDSPSITHGGLAAQDTVAKIAAKQYNAKIVQPKQYASGYLKEVFREYPKLEIVPTTGYSKKQINDLAKTLNKAKADAILFASYSNLKDLVKLNKPIARVTYDLVEIDKNILPKMVLKAAR